MYNEISLVEAVKDVITEKWRKLFFIKWYRRTIYNQRRRLKVWRNWKKHEEIIESIYAPWFDISEKGYLLYMSKQDNLYCMFCGCKYVPFDNEDWTKSEEERQNHNDACLWHKIERLKYYL